MRCSAIARRALAIGFILMTGPAFAGGRFETVSLGDGFSLRAGSKVNLLSPMPVPMRLFPRISVTGFKGNAVYLGPERSSQLLSLRQLKTAFDVGSGSARLDVSRAHSAKQTIEQPFLPYDRFATIALQGHWLHDIGSEDRFGFSGGLEKSRRRPGMDQGSGVIAHSFGYTVGPEWTHADRLRLGLDYVGTSHSGSASPVERMLALGGSVPIAARGFRIAAHFLSGGVEAEDRGGWNAGLALYRRRVDQLDNALVGGAPGGRDTGMMLSFLTRF